ncbi:MAG: hypothetical protein KG003_09645 [Bacteroidetes bacterium]|nr:hypothetical protein [Bacteroidota bacterium]
MRRLILVLSLSGLIWMTSCDKSQKHFKIDALMRSYFSFGNGSTWTYYSLSDSADKEQIVVQDRTEGKMVWDAFDQEFIQVDLASDKDSIYKLRVIADDQNTSRAVMFVKDTFFKHTMDWSCASGILSGIKGSGDSFTLHPSMTIAGKTYANVVELKPLHSVVYRKIFLAQNIGIVRKELLSGKTYVLKSYSVQ